MDEETMTAMLAMPRLPPKRMRLGENEKGEPSTVLAADTNLIVSLDYKWDLENYKSGKLPIRSTNNVGLFWLVVWDDDPTWRTHILQRGWNHQPANYKWDENLGLYHHIIFMAIHEL